MKNKRRNSSVPASEVSANTEEYLEWIYRLSKENDGLGDRHAEAPGRARAD
jgi:hypothetical protein